MPILNTIINHTVIIDGGSGVLFQPSDLDFTYVLTAKHNLYNGTEFNAFETKKNQVQITYYNSVDESFLELEPLIIQDGINSFEHPELLVDIAILKIARLDLDLELYPYVDFQSNLTNYIIAGHPNQLREAQNGTISRNTFRYNESITIQHEIEHRAYAAQEPNNITYDELKGVSGGGLYKIIDDYLFLVGIEIGVIDRAEALGRFRFVPIQIFDDIVNQYPELLEEIIPFHLKCFSFLSQCAFKIELGADNSEIHQILIEYLSNESEKIIDIDVAPIDLKRLFENRLLIKDTSPHFSECKEIWTKWFEFLTYLISSEIEVNSIDSIEQIQTKLRLIYSNSKRDWSHLRSRIENTDFADLKDGANVFVATESKPLNTRLSIVPNIGKPGSVRFKNSTVNSVFSRFTFIHFYAFTKECIIDNIEDLNNSENVEDLIINIKNGYKKILD